MHGSKCRPGESGCGSSQTECRPGESECGISHPRRGSGHPGRRTGHSERRLRRPRRGPARSERRLRLPPRGPQLFGLSRRSSRGGAPGPEIPGASHMTHEDNAPAGKRRPNGQALGWRSLRRTRPPGGARYHGEQCRDIWTWWGIECLTFRCFYGVADQSTSSRCPRMGGEDCRLCRGTVEWALQPISKLARAVRRPATLWETDDQ